MFKHYKKNNFLFINWLTISLILVFLMIIVGGYTRLTDSGLSITKWELFKGILPPLNNTDWNNYFELYKQIPQFILLNQNMTIEEFKVIFYWEFAHRFLGRMIGLFFLIPFIYFFLFKKENKRYLVTCAAILFLIIFQGLIGWYMVKSGLTENTTVSHYRLSLHLSVALVIISCLFWLLINIKRQSNIIFFDFSKKNLNIQIFLFLIFTQVILGAFVSGLDAGRVYQTWPLMGYSYFPDDIIIDNFKDFTDFNNHSLVQFYHRNLAYLILVYFIFLSIDIFRKNKTFLYRPLYIVLIFLLFQICLGILTLISGLNMYLASAHQIFSVLLIFSTLNLYYFYVK